MELFFMMTAMLALLGPIAVGRVRCVRVTPSLRNLVNYIVPMASESTMGAATASSSPALRAVGAWPPAAILFFPHWHSNCRSLHRYVRIALAPLTHAGQPAVLAA